MTHLNSKSVGLCLLLAAAPLFGQTAAAPTFKDVFLFQLSDVEKKVVDLAETTPQEKYSWRPAEGVRSVSEVFVHIAGANYFFPTMVGVKMPPKAFAPNSEKTVTDKAQVVALLKQSFAHVRDSVSALSDADMAKETKMFGKPATYQMVLFVMANHMHEHLGQSIAYARVNGIVPPWSKKAD
ncbi:MAG TPA: DinB family protein [Bryobacteraceae bacterium]|nr:DinB family protein [Bryobacteraceae bacterium]